MNNLKKAIAPHLMKRRLLKTIIALIATGGTGVIVLLTLLWSEHNNELRLPTPTGPFAVGRVTEAWADDKHIDAFAEAPDTRRELVVWIWYPSTGTRTAKAANYLPADWRGALAHHRGVLLSTFLTRDLALVHPHSAVDGTLSPEQPTYPVVILRAGLAALTTDYTTLAGISPATVTSWPALTPRIEQRSSSFPMDES